MEFIIAAIVAASLTLIKSKRRSKKGSAQATKPSGANNITAADKQRKEQTEEIITVILPTINNDGK